MPCSSGLNCNRTARYSHGLRPPHVRHDSTPPTAYIRRIATSVVIPKSAASCATDECSSRYDRDNGQKARGHDPAGCSPRLVKGSRHGAQQCDQGKNVRSPRNDRIRAHRAANRPARPSDKENAQVLEKCRHRLRHCHSPKNGTLCCCPRRSLSIRRICVDDSFRFELSARPCEHQVDMASAGRMMARQLYRPQRSADRAARGGAWAEADLGNPRNAARALF